MRQYAPDILLFANLGAVQLNYQRNYIDFCQRAVDMVEADALFLHLNPLQEVLQPEGDVHFNGLLEKIQKVVKSISVPVVVKEVGWGISASTAKRLEEVGVSAIDVAGAGGTSWSQVEMYRMADLHQRRVAASFVDWGISTADSLVQVKKATSKCLVFASGGIRNGLEMAKCIALGAKLVGVAGPFLKAALISEEETIQTIEEFVIGLKISMFATGTKNLDALARTKLIKT